jgi:hypothetical protein
VKTAEQGGASSKSGPKAQNQTKTEEKKKKENNGGNITQGT